MFLRTPSIVEKKIRTLFKHNTKIGQMKVSYLYWTTTPLKASFWPFKRPPQVLQKFSSPACRSLTSLSSANCSDSSKRQKQGPQTYLLQSNGLCFDWTLPNVSQTWPCNQITTTCRHKAFTCCGSEWWGTKKSSNTSLPSQMVLYEKKIKQFLLRSRLIKKVVSYLVLSSQNLAMNNDTTMHNKPSQKIKFECNWADNCREINLQLIQVGNFTNE